MAEPAPAPPPPEDSAEAADAAAETPASHAAPQPEDLHARLEAVLMVAAAPVGVADLARATGAPTHRVRSALEHLKADYDGVIGNTVESPDGGRSAGYDGRSAAPADAPPLPPGRIRGFELREVAGGWRIYSRSDYAHLVTDFVVEGSSSRLSQAALETLAVVAYLQPVSRSRVSAIRGVNVDGVVRTLVQRGLLTVHDREDTTGSVLYSTTPLFLEKLGLGSLDELPDIAPLLPGTDQLDDIED
ncbi:SMC-Scp complex subunit ScpB [Kocuria sp.]|uniref:SMC-Scp complex subunit ScpB n=1 Tax=Kocuria sp. TaxID=1871328 RepID=UPI0026DA7713|nr:SMC-Scp complex subunit ScpB [Kocuria sp.]MDO4919889.1 SMC-Scp complex subunit ScpB [Kocuria sp.]